MEETLAGITTIAKARALDVISLGIDQDAQENFFHPERQNPRSKAPGAHQCGLPAITVQYITPVGVVIIPCSALIQEQMILSS